LTPQFTTFFKQEQRRVPTTVAMSMPSPEQIADMLAHASDDLRVNIVACVTVCATLATVIVAARIYARWIHGNALLLADYLIIVALVRCLPSR
jgi:hypothetical protein